jgi:hypothetical protein
MLLNLCFSYDLPASIEDEPFESIRVIRRLSKGLVSFCLCMENYNESLRERVPLKGYG